MSAPRFFTDAACAADAIVDLHPDDAHHAAHVLRLQPGDAVVLVGADGPWDAEVQSSTRTGVRVRVRSRSEDAGGELPVEVVVLQAVTKGSRFDDVVEKTIELGARRIVPVRCARSYGEASEHRVERWRRIARAAAAQSRRRTLPRVDDPVDWRDAIERHCAIMPVLVGWERAERRTLATAIARCDGASAIGIAVGPEGSLTDEELGVARDAGCSLVWLGPTILRTDTAALAMLAALASGCGWW